MYYKILSYVISIEMGLYVDESWPAFSRKIDDKRYALLCVREPARNSRDSLKTSRRSLLWIIERLASLSRRGPSAKGKLLIWSNFLKPVINNSETPTYRLRIPNVSFAVL